MFGIGMAEIIVIFGAMEILLIVLTALCKLIFALFAHGIVFVLG